MPQWPSTPMVPRRPTQRGWLPSVPRMASSCRRSGITSSGGGPSGLSGWASDQWKDTRKVAQQAPQRRQGWLMGHGGSKDYSMVKLRVSTTRSFIAISTR